MEITIEHGLEPAVAAERLAALAQEHEVELESAPDGLSGTIARDSPFGAVRGTWRIVPGALVVEVVDRPAFVPEGMVRRAVEEHLASALSE